MKRSRPKDDIVFHRLRATQQEGGAAFVEYVFLIGLIAVTLIMSISFFTARIAMSFSEAGDSLQATVSVQSDSGTDDDNSDNDNHDDNHDDNNDDNHDDNNDDNNDDD